MKATPTFIFSILFFLLITSVSFKSKECTGRFFMDLVTDTLPQQNNLIDSIGEAVFEKVEVEASFKGGLEGWTNFLQGNLKPDTPAKHKAPSGQYTVVVQFIVGKQGQISAIQALTRHGYGMETEVVRVLKKSPRWNPAIQDHHPVNAYRKQPITFIVP